jgi:hypothetical protein
MLLLGHTVQVHGRVDIGKECAGHMVKSLPCSTNDIVTTRNVKYPILFVWDIWYDVYGRRSFICMNRFYNMDSF